MNWELEKGWLRGGDSGGLKDKQDLAVRMSKRHFRGGNLCEQKKEDRKSQHILWVTSDATLAF